MERPKPRSPVAPPEHFSSNQQQDFLLIKLLWSGNIIFSLLVCSCCSLSTSSEWSRGVFPGRLHPCCSQGMTPRVCFPFLPLVNEVCCLLGAQARQLILQNGLTLSDLDRNPEVSGTMEMRPHLAFLSPAPSESIQAPQSSPEAEFGQPHCRT